MKQESAIPVFGMGCPFHQEKLKMAADMASDLQIDKAVMAVLAGRHGRWVKVAWVVVSVTDALAGDFRSEETARELVAKRIAVLVDEGQLIAKGDLTRPRFSEIKPVSAAS
jgi:hypothetical protein